MSSLFGVLYLLLFFFRIQLNELLLLHFWRAVFWTGLKEDYDYACERVHIDRTHALGYRKDER
jgi:hypothetical protein